MGSKMRNDSIYSQSVSFLACTLLFLLLYDFINDSQLLQQLLSAVQRLVCLLMMGLTHLSTHRHIIIITITACWTVNIHGPSCDVCDYGLGWSQMTTLYLSSSSASHGEREGCHEREGGRVITGRGGRGYCTCVLGGDPCHALYATHHNHDMVVDRSGPCSGHEGGGVGGHMDLIAHGCGYNHSLTLDMVTSPMYLWLGGPWRNLGGP